jgi:hypothetical protein
MLPFIGRPWKTKTRTQSSEHGVVATGEQDHFLGRLSVERHVWLLGAPEVMEQHAELASHGNNGLALGLFTASCSQMQTPLSKRRVSSVRSEDMVGTLDQ